MRVVCFPWPRGCPLLTSLTQGSMSSLASLGIARSAISLYSLVFSTPTLSYPMASAAANVDPDAFESFEVVEVPPSSTEGLFGEPTPLRKVVRPPQRHKRRGGGPRPPATPGSSAQYTAYVAEKMVWNYLKGNDAEAEYFQSKEEQERVGCDFRSQGRYIKTKGFSGSGGSFAFQRSQRTRAEEEGMNYYLYIVTNLGAGSSPVIWIIQDPLNNADCVLEKPSSRRVVSWEFAASKKITVTMRQDDAS